MQEIDASKAKTQLSSLLSLVAKGERIVITKHGSPVAILEPFKDEKNTSTKAVIAEIRRFRKNLKLRGLSIKKMIETGRR